MVIRGSNEPNPTGAIPAYKWKTLSTDFGRTWSKPTPFTLDNGDAFLSPSSCSTFIRSSRTGRAYWIGNISRSIPSGNAPRYPLVIAELDEERLSLRRKTLTVVDDRAPNEPPDLQLSNFDLVEDEETGELVLQLMRRSSFPGVTPPGPFTLVIRVQ